MNNILEATRINKIVELGKNNELHILKDVNLEIKEGEFVAVMGGFRQWKINTFI
ncbi:hypothetical protein LSPH24S_02077 [Lysinibacillus sphaericus]